MCTSLIHLRKKVSWPTPCASRAKEKKVHYFLPWHKKAKPLLTWFVMTCDCAIFKFLCECQSSGPCTMAFRLPLNKSILKWNIVIDFFSATISFMIFRFSALCASRFFSRFVTFSYAVLNGSISGCRFCLCLWQSYAKREKNAATLPSSSSKHRRSLSASH